ncbi:hypothetical protein [Tautonia plasticadhaerens]|nr:hypothetical protein [Tautonia plasticadhaerens]
MAGNQEIDLGAEVERVRGELFLFRDVILPVFYQPGGINPVQAASGGAGLLAEITHEMIDWQRASTRLVEALPAGPESGEVPAPDRDSFKPFMFQEASASYSARGGRIAWRIAPYLDWDVAAAQAFWYLGDESPDDPLAAILGDLHGFSRRVLELPVDGSPLMDILCLTAPMVADADPAMIRRMLDPETYRRHIRTARGITPEARERRLGRLDGYFRHALNNALLHALGGLACNRFEELPDLLGHPDLLGGYTELMPHYLFAVLFEKVSILHRIARESLDPGSP